MMTLDFKNFFRDIGRRLRALQGLDFPDPVAGQVWRSTNSGRAFRVTEVRFTDDGTLVTTVEFEMLMMTRSSAPGRPRVDTMDFNPLSADNIYGLGRWRRRLRADSRKLESIEVPDQAEQSVPPWITEVINRRVVIEQELLDMAKRGESASAAQLRDIALRLGTPRPWVAK